MILVSSPLTGNNHLTWSCSIKCALRAKIKLGFIDGTSMKPEVTDDNFEQWIGVDSMVTTWILNLISKDIVEAFLYTTSAHSLWLELEERYGECNGPLLCQLQREIASLAQGEMSVVAYYTKLKKLWDELAVLMPIPQCTCNGCNCGAAKAVADLTLFNQLIQFLMGLDDVFDNVRNQLLVMEPLPLVNKTYSIVQRVEKQRQVHMELEENTNNRQCMLGEVLRRKQLRKEG